MCNAESAHIDTGTDIIKSLITTMGLQAFIVCMNNAFAHGEVFEAMGEPVNNDELGKLFGHIEGLADVAKEINGE